MFEKGSVQSSSTKVASTVKEQINVMRGLRKALIGRPAITVLQLLCRVNTVDSIE